MAPVASHVGFLGLVFIVSCGRTVTFLTTSSKNWASRTERPSSLLLTSRYSNEEDSSLSLAMMSADRSIYCTYRRWREASTVCKVACLSLRDSRKFCQESTTKAMTATPTAPSASSSGTERPSRPTTATMYSENTQGYVGSNDDRIHSHLPDSARDGFRDMSGGTHSLSRPTSTKYSSKSGGVKNGAGASRRVAGSSGKKFGEKSYESNGYRSSMGGALNREEKARQLERVLKACVSANFLAPEKKQLSESNEVTALTSSAQITVQHGEEGDSKLVTETGAQSDFIADPVGLRDTNDDVTGAGDRDGKANADGDAEGERARSSGRRVWRSSRHSLTSRVGGDGVVTLTEMNHAITTAGRQNRFSDALLIFESIPLLGFTPDLMSYNNIIWCAGNVGRTDVAKRLFNEIGAKSPSVLVNKNGHGNRRQNSGRLYPNVYTYGAMMHGFAKTKSYRQALAYLDKMIDEGVVPNQIVFTSAMEACAEAGMYKEALAVMDRIAALNLQPDLTMINTAIKACSLAGAMDQAEALAEQLRNKRKMDLFTYHTLMMGHTKLASTASLQRVLFLYEEAVTSGAKLDGGVYSLAMLAALSSGQYPLVPRIADRAREQCVQLTEASYTTLIQAYAEAGFVDAAVQCLQTMEQEGLQPNVITYAAIMAACKDRPAQVLQLLEDMTQRLRISPNTIVLTTAINSLARAPGGNYTDIAYGMLQEMERNGPKPNIYTYNTVTRAFAQAGRLEEAMAVLQTIKQRKLMPDRYTFTTLLMACGRTNSSEKVDSVMVMMKEAGVVPDKISYGAAMDAHRRAGNSLKALECLQGMYKHRLEPSAAHYNLVIRTMRAEGYVEKMFKMVMSIARKEDVKINGNTFELVMEALLEEGGPQPPRWKEALVLLGEMERLGIRPSLEVCVTLVDQLEKARQFRGVLAIYKFMVKNGYDFYENSLLNGVFKRLVNVAAKGTKSGLAPSVSPSAAASTVATENVASAVGVQGEAERSELQSDEDSDIVFES